MDHFHFHHRPLSADELADLWTRSQPHRPQSPQIIERAQAMRQQGELHWSYGAYQGQSVLGLSELTPPLSDQQPGWLEINLLVEQAQQHTELGLQLLQQAETQAQALEATTLVARVDEDVWSHEFLKTQGFQERDRMWISLLDLRTLDFGAFEDVEVRPKAAGVEIRPLSEFLPLTEALERRLYELIVALLLDVPSQVPIAPWSFELWRKRIIPQLTVPEGLMLAIAPDGRWIGLNEAYLPYEALPNTIANGLTGVLSEWRGHGIALALKLAGARAALARGYTHIRTGNHASNQPMLRINDHLGFVRSVARVILFKEL